MFDPEDVEPEDFELTIYYRYRDGSTAAPTYTEINSEGSSYFVPSPEIPGYTASNPVVSGTQPGRNIERTVIYVPDDGSIIIEDYGMPLGLGSSFVNTGDCQD